MKSKVDPKIWLFGLLLIASIGAYGYLNHPDRVSGHIPAILDAGKAYERYEQVPPANDPLPDIQILQKLLEMGKRLIPAQ